MASILAAFDISMAIGIDGKPIRPGGEYNVASVVTYVPTQQSKNGFTNLRFGLAVIRCRLTAAYHPGLIEQQRSLLIVSTYTYNLTIFVRKFQIICKVFLRKKCLRLRT